MLAEERVVQIALMISGETMRTETELRAFDRLTSGHDPWVHHPGVIQAIKDFCARRDSVFPDTGIWRVR